jgi:hypothetical protein
VWVCLAAVSGYTVSSKVFSPQYLLWLLPMVAVGLLVDPSPKLRAWASWLLVAAGLSHLVYPLLYRYLVIHSWQSVVVVPLLVGRNALVVVLFVVAAREAWRATGDVRESVGEAEAASPVGAHSQRRTRRT